MQLPKLQCISSANNNCRRDTYNSFQKKKEPKPGFDKLLQEAIANQKKDH